MITLFEWDLKKAEWYDRALESSEYPEVFMPLIAELVRGARTALDACAGIGALTLPLARLVPSVTAVDSSSLALEYLSIRARRADLSNIQCLEVPWENFSGGPFDIVAAAYPADCVVNSTAALKRLNGMAARAVALILPTAKGRNKLGLRAILPEPAPGEEGHARITAGEVHNLLTQLGIEPAVTVYRYDFGQPLSSRSEALEFVKSYVDIPVSTISLVERWLDRSLIRRDKGFYLPIHRESALVCWRTSSTTVQSQPPR